MSLISIPKWTVFFILNYFFYLKLKLLNKIFTHKIHVKYRCVFYVNFTWNSFHVKFTRDDFACVGEKLSVVFIRFGTFTLKVHRLVVRMAYQGRLWHTSFRRSNFICSWDYEFCSMCNPSLLITEALNMNRLFFPFPVQGKGT